ncbi:MAG: YtxH domain-containing protein [Chloroflexi bacterium]|nr:YtxH domain-containing protein [Chloroflexota bacterium]
MELALGIFNIGAGIGILAVGAAVVYLAWRLTPLVGETRALTWDLRRLTRTTETELRPLLDRARDLTRSDEVLTEDAAVKVAPAVGSGRSARRDGTPAHHRRSAPGRGGTDRIDRNARGTVGPMKDSGFGSFLAGVVIGGLVGAALGLLLAPETGEEFREHVGEFVDSKRAELGDAVNEGRAAAEQARAEMVGDYQAQPEGSAL